MTLDTLCWNCNHAYPMSEPCCEKCGATNGNIDPKRANAEALGERAIEEPAFLRQQVA